MTDEPEPAGRCDRALLVLSLDADGAATPSQAAELAAHLPGCADCRRARAADLAVRGRLRERAGAAAPAWLDSFAERTAARALLDAREFRRTNRLLAISAAAAVLVALTAQFALPGGLGAGGPAPHSPTNREATRLALLGALPGARTEKGK